MSEPGRRRVLVVDDEPAVLEVTIRLIEELGCVALGAASAEEGFERLSAGRFDLVLMDVGLPGQSGLLALTEFLARSDAPVILMSGHVDPELAQDAKLLGARCLLQKPIELATLREALALPADA